MFHEIDFDQLNNLIGIYSKEGYHNNVLSIIHLHSLKIFSSKIAFYVRGTAIPLILTKHFKFPHVFGFFKFYHASVYDKDIEKLRDAGISFQGVELSERDSIDRHYELHQFSKIYSTCLRQKHFKPVQVRPTVRVSVYP